MPSAWAHRHEAFLRDSRVSPDVFSPRLDRLGPGVLPSQQALAAQAGPPQVPRSLAGLLAPLHHQKAEASAAWVEGERQGIPACSGTAPWAPRLFIPVVGGHGAARWGEPAGLIACAPRRCPQRGPHAVGGQCHGWGHRGKGDTRQGEGIARAYAASPLWRSRAAVLGSRPRNSRKISIGGRLPPSARMELR
jgi:hypothetical protein